jgi:uncharacterized protein with PIN domain
LLPRHEILRHPPAFEPVRFVVDSTLGKLAKYLRLAGFDTLQDTQIPDAGRLADMAGGKGSS